MKNRFLIGILLILTVTAVIGWSVFYSNATQLNDSEIASVNISDSNNALNNSIRENEKIIKIPADAEKMVDGSQISSASLAFDPSDLEYLADNAEYIIIGHVKSIDGVINFNPTTERYVMTRTVGTIEVLNVIKGELQDSEIPFIRIGGTIPVSEYIKSQPVEKVTRLQSMGVLPTEDLENTYFVEMFNGDIEIKEDKTYLMYLGYYEDYDRYSILYFEYGLREVEQESDVVINNEKMQSTNELSKIKVKNNKTTMLYETLDSILPKSLISGDAEN